MRSFSHWSLRYVWSRYHEIRYRRLNPDAPWLTAEAVSFLNSYLRPLDQGLELGSGRSTLWFANRTGGLVSVEHDPDWYEQTRNLLIANGVEHVKYILHSREAGSDEDGFHTAYVREVQVIAPQSLDFALVDGIYRGGCAASVLQAVKPGGLVIIDNANLYIPHHSFSPNSRLPGDPPATLGWENFVEQVKNWRYYWTSNGIFDTAFYFKPQA